MTRHSWSSGSGRPGRAAVRLALLLLALAACGGSIEDPSDPGNPGADGGNPDDPLAGMLSPEEQALLDTINDERARRGLTLVTLRPSLLCAAARHSQDIGATRTCTHTGSDGSSPTVRVDECGGGGWTGEIVACGQPTPREAVDAWLASPGHNMIMTSPTKREVGVAMHDNFWTAIFDD